VPLGHERERFVHPFELFVFAGLDHTAVADGMKELVTSPVVCGRWSLFGTWTSIAILPRQT
jgi:hypothetical protein